MRLFVRVAVLGIVFGLLAGPLPAGASEIPRVGERLFLLAAPGTFPADEPFHVIHGFGVEGASDPSASAISDYDFTLFVDGEEVHGAREVVVEDGEWVSITWIFNFRHGLPAGDHTFEGHWHSPDGPEFIQDPTVEFIAACGA